MHGVLDPRHEVRAPLLDARPGGDEARPRRDRAQRDEGPQIGAGAETAERTERAHRIGERDPPEHGYDERSRTGLDVVAQDPGEVRAGHDDGPERGQAEAERRERQRAQQLAERASREDPPRHREIATASRKRR